MTQWETASGIDMSVMRAHGHCSNEAVNLFVPLGTLNQPNEVTSRIPGASGGSSCAWLPSVHFDSPPDSPSEPAVCRAIPAIAIYDTAPRDFYPGVPRISTQPIDHVWNCIPSIAIYEGAPADFYPSVPRISSEPARFYRQSLSSYFGPSAQNRVFATDPNEAFISLTRSQRLV